MLAALLRALFFTFYRRRAAREQYFCRFIVTVRRGNNIFAILSSPRGAETISLPFYRRRAAREQYFCHFIVVARRGNNIFAILSSPRGAGTISLPFYRRRAAREQYFRISSFAALLRALKFLFSLLQNGGTCWNGRGGAYVPARTSAQRRFHRQNIFTHHARGFNDGCALAGRHGRAHRPAPTKLHHAFLHHSIKRHHPSTCNPPITNRHFGRVPAIPSII